MKARIISLVMLLVLFASCKKEKNEVAPTSQNSIAAAKTAPSTSPCPESIRLTGNSPSGNKLQAHFNPANVPYAIRVVQNGTATTDQSSTAGNSGVWNSQDKYTSPELGLQLLDANGNIICTCNYDAQGKLIPAIVNASVISDYTVDFDGVFTATISWKSVEEVGVKAYVVERYDAFTLDKNLLIQGAGITGPGSTYTLVDEEVYSIPSNYNYKLFAIFNDNTKLLLAEKQVVPPVVVQNLNAAYDPTVGFVMVSWQVVNQGLYTGYSMQRGDANGANFEQIFWADAVGSGTFSFPDPTIPDNGTYTYRMVGAIHNQNYQQEVARAVVNITGLFVPPDAEVSNFALTNPAENVVTLRWTSTIEFKVDYFYFERQDPGSNDFVKIENFQYGLGQGGIYGTDDVVPGPGTYTYRLRAYFLDNSISNPLATSMVVIP